MSLSFHPASVFHRSLSGLLAVLMLCGPATSTLAQRPPNRELRPAITKEPSAANTALLAKQPPATEFDLSYVLPQAALVVVASPAQVLKSAAMEMLPIEVIQAAMLQETGLDPMQAEQVVFSASPPAQGPPNYTALVRFSEPAQLKSQELTRHTVPGELNGKEYFQSQQPMAPSIYQPDTNSFLLTPDFSLQQLMDADRVNNPAGMQARVAAAAHGDDLFAMLDVAAIRPILNGVLAQAELPPELADLRRLPELISLVELRLNLSNQGMSEFIVTANDESAAKELVALAERNKSQVFARMNPDMQKLLNADDPIEQAQGRYLQRMSKTWNEGLQIQREGNRLILLRHDPKVDGSGGMLASYATIGVLVALLLPAVQSAREAARRSMSINNIKQINLALLNYESANGSFPAHANYGENDKPLLSWRVHILPYLEQQALYDQFHLDEPWDSEHNKPLIAKMPQLYAEPSSKLDPKDGKTQYLAPVGAGMVFDGSADNAQLRTITDGTSNTIVVLQVSDDAAVEWTKPEDWQLNVKNPLAELGGPHPGVFLVGFCDGSVRTVSELIDVNVFKALLTKAGGEVVQGGF